MSPDSANLQPLNSRSLPDGYAEFKFADAIRDLITACGGNRKIAQGVAIEIIKQETERRTNA